MSTDLTALMRKALSQGSAWLEKGGCALLPRLQECLVTGQDALPGGPVQGLTQERLA